MELLIINCAGLVGVPCESNFSIAETLLCQNVTLGELCERLMDIFHTAQSLS
jgi:hypothetical protein